jgi:hypothetical protein
MMRFRAVAWSLGISAAATGLYLISLQVAAERGRLEQTETKIMLAKADIRRLNTELGTRGSLRQLEQWNGEVLALSAPKANQFLQGKVQLASLDGATLDRVAGPAQLIAVNATVQKPAPRLAAPTPAPVRPAADAVSNLRYATYTPETQSPASRAPAAVVRKVAFTTLAPEPAKTLIKPPVAKLDVKPKALNLAPAPEAAKPAKVSAKPAPLAVKPAATKKTMLQTGTLASLAKAAKAEGGR